MSETEAVKEARRWRREVYNDTRNLTRPERRAREEELLRAAREAGVEFEEVIDADAAPSRTSTPPPAGNG